MALLYKASPPRKKTHLTCNQVVTSLGPMELLDRLQAIEKGLGRQKTVDKGPRSIDLDIILYNNERISNERLKVPHELMHERDFVLRPLSQYVYSLWR